MIWGEGRHRPEYHRFFLKLNTVLHTKPSQCDAVMHFGTPVGTDGKIFFRVAEFFQFMPGEEGVTGRVVVRVIRRIQKDGRDLAYPVFGLGNGYF